MEALLGVGSETASSRAVSATIASEIGLHCRGKVNAIRLRRVLDFLGA